MPVAPERNQNASALIYPLSMYFSHALIGLGVKRMPRPLSESRKPESRRKTAVLRGMRLRPIDSPPGFPGQPCAPREREGRRPQGSLFSLSAPGGGEDRGEVGELQHNAAAPSTSPSPSLWRWVPSLSPRGRAERANPTMRARD